MTFHARAVALALLVGGLSAVGAAPASALTLGTTASGAGPRALACPVDAVSIQTGSDGSFTPRVPDGQAGLVTSWSFNATATPPGTKIGLVVVRPTDAGFTATGVDFQTVPTQTAPGVVTFPLTTPLPIEAGGAIGLFATAGTICASVEPADTANLGTGMQATAPPAVGDQYPTLGGPGIVNLSAEVDTSQDLSLTSSSTAGVIPTGATSSVIFTTASRLPTAGSGRFVATVPAGLRLVTAIAGTTPCDVLGTSVSCNVSLSGAVPPTVVLVVAGDVAGTYPVSGTITGNTPDRSPADNTATSSITVVAPAVQTRTVVGPPTYLPPPCSTVALGGLTTSVASRLLTALHCKPVVGKAKSSKTVKKGLVITTDPGPSKTLASGATVQLIVSSGKPKTKKKAPKKAAKKT